MLRNPLVISLFCLLHIVYFSENNQVYSQNNSNLPARFIDNTFFSIGIGGQTYLSEHYRSGNIEDHISPEININVDKFSENNILGLRLGFARSIARGYNLSTSYYVHPSKIGDGSYIMEFDYFNIYANLLFNFQSYYEVNPYRIYELVPYIGIGWFGVLKDGIDRSEPTINAGIINQFKITDNFHIDLELKGVIVRSIIDGNPRKYVNIPASAILALRYKFTPHSKYIRNSKPIFK